MDERIEILCEILKPRFANVEVDVFQGLLVDYASQKKARVIVRGIRAVTDYEYEFQMALMNRRLAPGIETLFMMPRRKLFLCQLPPGEGDCRIGRLRCRPRAGDRREPVEAEI